MLSLGTVPAGSTLYIPFSTYGGTNGESITCTGLAVTDIEIYKNGSATQRASDAGYALLDTDGIDFDAITGIHGFSIDLSDNTDAGFYAVGSFYWVIVSSITVDTQTVNFIAATFRIGPAETVTGYQNVNVTHISGDSTAADNLETSCDGGAYNIGGGAVVAASVTGAVGSVAAGGIAAASFAAGAIDATAIKDGAIDAATFAAGAIDAAAIADGAIDAATFAANAITSTVIADDAITAAKLNTGAITADAFAADALVAGTFATNSITADALAADAVTEIQTGLALEATSQSILTDTGTTLPGTLTTIEGKVDTVDGIVDSILVDTNELQTDLTNGGRLDLLIDAIKAKTDLLPVTPAKNEALPQFVFLMIDNADHVSPKQGLTVTGAISKDGGAFAGLINPIAEISDGYYKITGGITQAEMNADLVALKFSAVGADQRSIIIVTSS